MTHKTEKILAQIAQDPTKSRLIEIGVSVENLEKEKRELKASKGNLDKNAKNARLAEINTELSKLKAEKENIKKSKSAKPEAPQNHTAEPVVVVDQPVVVTSESVAPQEPSNSKAEALVGNNEKLAKLAKLKEEKKQEDIKAIKLGKEMGQSKDALVDLGIDRALIDSIYNAPPQKEVDQKKMDAVMQQILLYIESEREEEEEYQKEKAKKIARLEANEKKLAELIELRSKLLAQENQSEVVRGEPENITQPIELSIDLPEGYMEEYTKENPPKIKELELEADENEHEPEPQKTEEDHFKIDEGVSQNIQNMQRMIAEFRNNINLYNQKGGELSEIEYTKYGAKLWKYITEPFKKRKIEKERKEIIKRQEELREKFEQEERKEFPLAYYAVEKIKDPVIKNLFMHEGKDGPYISMQDYNKISNNYSNRIYDPIHLETVAKIDNKTVIQANVFGFSMRALDISKVLDKNNQYKPDNPEARFDIVDNEGTVIFKNVDYNNGRQVYDEASWNYRWKVEEEWNKLNKK